MRIGRGTWLLGALGGLFAVRAGIRRMFAYELRDRVVLITGGSRGLGLELARIFGNETARVAICARDTAELARARLQLAELGVDALSIPCDITDKGQVEDMVQQVTAQLGPIDVLVNN